LAFKGLIVKQYVVPQNLGAQDGQYKASLESLQGVKTTGNSLSVCCEAVLVAVVKCA